MTTARRHPPSARARRLGERLAAARRSGDADRHGAARRRAPWRRSRQGLRARRAARRGHRAAARDASPSRPRRPRRHDPAPLGRDRGRARPGGRLRRALLGRGRGGPAVRARADDATTACRTRSSPTPRSSGTTSAPRPRTSAPTCGWPTAIACAPAGAACGSSRDPATARRTRCSSTIATASRSSATTCWRRISSNTEICAPDRAPDGRARSRLRYLENLERTQAMPLDAAADRPRRAGHRAPAARRRARLRDHRRRCERILAILGDGPRTAFEIAGGLWPERTVLEQPLLVVWEVVGNLELLLDARRRGRAGRRRRLGVRAHRGRARERAPRRRPRRRPVPDCAGRR